jgi:ribosomal protein S18 acetylase RimI-like enzyme
VASASEGTGPLVAPGPPRKLVSDDLPRAVSAISRAFAWHEPWGAWALPAESTREQILTGLVEADLRRRFLPLGECWTIAGACVSLWMPPPSRDASGAFARRRGPAEYAVYGERGEALRAGDDLIARLKPPGEVWYLDTLATEPESMRRGLGARLLDHDLAIRDSRGEAAALDTHTAENVAFYERRGFEVIGSERLPAGGPDLYVMLRPARPARPAGRRSVATAR